MATKKSDPAEVVVEILDDSVIEEVIEDIEVEEEVVEVIETVSNPYSYFTIRAFPSDNYLTIAERHLPEGKTVKQFANEICELNRCASVRANAKINIPK